MGVTDGCHDGILVIVGEREGVTEGDAVGLCDGLNEGICDGIVEGNKDGATLIVGLLEGIGDLVGAQVPFPFPPHFSDRTAPLVYTNS